MNLSFSFIIDVGILVLLAATVFLAFRLTISLRNFRESRFEMEGLVNRLTGNVDQAEKAIMGMQNTARKTGLELDEIISDAKKLADELKFMNEAGNSLANRLEKLAEKNREFVDKIENAGGAGAAPIIYKEPSFKQHTQTHSPLQKESMDDDVPGFIIQDRDLQDDDDELEFMLGGGDAGGLQSQAERELFEALNKKRKISGGRN